MFAVHLRRAYRACDEIIIRSLRGNYNPKGSNPGIDKRIQAFKEDGIKITADDAHEFIEQSNSDFYKVGEAYNEHLNETLMGKYEIQNQIIKKKYFKENMPNLLTWSEKEQIRHLAQEQSEEWTLDRLAESFPVTVPVIKKLLKYKWQPATEERIARHDASVMRNWRELKEGSLNIPDNLRQHFLKFSNRKIPPLNKKSIKIDLTQEERMGEYEKIVQRCASNENVNNTSHDKMENVQSEKITEQRIRKDAKVVTLEELTDKIKKRIQKGKKVTVPDKMMLDTMNSQIATTPNNIEFDLELSEAEQREQNKLAAYKDEEETADNVIPYPERIRIPKKAYKKGATYKVNDCYYDHDGRFLYRVLGMANNK